MGDSTTCVYQFIYDENENDDTKIIKYFAMHGLGLCIKVDSHMSSIFYAWLFSNNTAVPIFINKNKYYIAFNTHTTVFAWGASNSNKNRT